MPRLILLSILLLPAIGFAQVKKPVKDTSLQSANSAYQTYLNTSNLPPFKASFTKLEKLHPTHPITFYYKGVIALGEDNVNEAMMQFTKAITTSPGATDALFQRAVLFNEKGLYDKALADVNQYISLKPSPSAQAFSNRGDYKRNKGDLEGALSDFKQAIDLSPSSAPYYRGYITVATELKRPKAVEDLMQNALSGTQSANAGVRLAYANFLLRDGRFSEADAQFSKALNDGTYAADAADLQNGSIAAYKLKDYNRARNMLDRALKIDPQSFEVLINIANVAIDQGKWEDVYQHALKAYQLQPESSMANMMMAVGVKQTNRGNQLAASYEAKAKKLNAEGK